MLKILSLVTITIAVLIVLMIGARTISAQEQATGWTTYYNPDYKFAFDYPDNSSISNLPGTWFDKSFISPKVSFVVNVNESSLMDPQELAVINSLTLPPYQTLMEGGVHQLVQDGIEGFYYLVMNHKSESIMTFAHFSNNGNAYSFKLLDPNGSFDTRDINQVVSSIKFFD
jgi:hypothetical protein